jgi:hypothetical protein
LREALYGEKVSVERKISWRDFSAERGFKERLSPWREQPRRERLRGETLSMVKPLRGEMIFQESYGRLWCENGIDQFLTS